MPSNDNIHEIGEIVGVFDPGASGGGGAGDRQRSGCSDACRKRPNRRRSHKTQEQLERGGMAPWRRAVHCGERAVSMRRSGGDRAFFGCCTGAAEGRGDSGEKPDFGFREKTVYVRRLILLREPSS
jgi:hypothetical protein